MSLTLKSPKSTTFFSSLSFLGIRFSELSLIIQGGTAPLRNLSPDSRLIINPTAKNIAAQNELTQSLLGGLLPGIWNAPDRGTCTLFYERAGL
jgi:hypothetical protein